jgi:hypothetical protein
MQIDVDQQMTPHGQHLHLNHTYFKSHNEPEGTNPMTTYQVMRRQIIRVNDVEERIVYAVTDPTGQVSEVARWEGSHVVCLMTDCDGAAFCSRAHCDQPHRHAACAHVDAVMNAVFEGRVEPDQLHASTTDDQPPSIHTPEGHSAMNTTIEHTQTPEDFVPEADADGLEPEGTEDLEDSTPDTTADAAVDTSAPAPTPATKYAMFLVTKIEGAVKVSLTVDSAEVWSNLPNPKGNGGDKSAIASGKQRAFKVCERRGYTMVDVGHRHAGGYGHGTGHKTRGRRSDAGKTHPAQPQGPRKSGLG